MELSMTPFIVAVALVLLYPLFAALVLRLTEGVRDELAILGRELLTSPTINEDKKQFISDLLDDVFDWRFMALACLRFPITVWELVKGRRGLSRDERNFLDDPRVGRFISLHMVSVQAAAPLWTIVFWIVAAISVLLAIAFIGVGVLTQLWFNTAEHVAIKVQTNHQFSRAINGR
jgi:hypothetical protein